MERPFFVRIEAQERNGALYELEAEDYEARAILHEIDHLNGVLFDSKIIRVVDPSELEERTKREWKAVEVNSDDEDCLYGNARVFGSCPDDAS